MKKFTALLDSTPFAMNTKIIVKIDENKINM